jgi:DNA-binding YbaB/EbfC family protein
MNRPPDMRQLLQQAQQMQQQLAEAQERLATEEFEGSAGGGMVTAVVTGASRVVSVSINPDVIDPDDSEMLEDLVVAAVNAALTAAAEATEDSLGGLGGGMDLGGLFG